MAGTAPSPEPSHDWARQPLGALLSLLAMGPRRGVFLALVFIGKAAPVLLLPLFVEHVVATLSTPSSARLALILLPALAMIALQLLNIPLHTLFTHMVSRHIRDAEHGLRSALIRKLQHLSISYHRRTQSGELQAKVLRDVEQVENFLRLALTRSFQIALTFAFAIVVTLVKEPVVLAFYLIAAPASVLVIRLFGKDLTARNQDFRQEMEDMSSSVSEMIDMIPVTRAHGLEQHEIERVDRNLQRIHQSGHRLDRLNAVFESSAFMTLQITQVICLMFTGTLCARGVITVAELVLYQFLFGLIVQSVGEVLYIVPQMRKGLASLDSLGIILAEDDIESAGQGRTRLEQVVGEIEFRDVGYSYGSGWAVRRLSFRAQPGDCIALVGESGAGKSTVMNLIIGLFQPQEGRILLDGTDQRELDLRDWRRHVAVVPQSTLLFSGSLRENICYGVGELDEAQLLQVIEAARLTELVDELPDGLETPIGENGVRLSGGQRQRIAIARALIRDPRVIILDEATSSLDVISEHQVQLALASLIRDRTTFIVAHRLSTTRRATRVIVMKGGVAVESNSPEALLAADGEFARLRALQ